MSSSKNKGVLVIYTGGTIGSLPKDPNNPESPLVVVPWEELVKRTPILMELDFRIDNWSFPEPKDSCNIGPAEWRIMAEVIEKNYDEYEGFVILHGTDTMVYTASVLSFMLVNLGKPVILTGAQRSMLFQVRNDALQNLITSLQIANPAHSGIPVVPEVCIFFRDDLLRGNRSIKMDASGYNAYASPNFPRLGWAGDRIHIDTRHLRPIPTEPFRIRRNINTNVISFNVFPGIQNTDMVQRLLSTPNLRGVILCSFGTGNIPNDKKFLEPFYEATQRGVIIQVVTQCTAGMVELGLYDTSARLLEMGILSGLDITAEAALCKMMVLLGDEDLTTSEVADLMQQDLEGEMSLSIFTIHFKQTDRKFINSSASRIRIASSEGLPGNWKAWRISTALLRFRKSVVRNIPETEPLLFKIFANVASSDPLDEESINFAGEFRILPNPEASVVSFDVTRVSRRLFKPGMKISFSVCLSEDSKGSLEWESAEFCIYVGTTVDAR